jgi:hypothetical protein
VTTAGAGRVVRRRRRRLARPARALAGLGLAALVLAAAPAGLAGAAGDAARGATGAAPAGVAGAAGQSTAVVELVGQPAWVLPGEPYDVQVRVTGAPAGATLDMVVHDRLESRSEFRATLDEGELGGTEHQVGPQPLAALPAAPGGAVTVGFTPGSELSSKGVYPVEVSLRGPDDEVLGSLVTYLSYLWDTAPPGPPLDVAVIVDVGAAPALQPDGSSRLPDGALDRTLERVGVLSDTTGVPLTLAPRPETLEALAQAELPTSATVEQLRGLAAGLPVFARPFVDVDLAALQAAGLTSEANAQADGGANVVRSRLAVEPTGGMWLSGPTYGADAARQAVDLGIGRAVVPPSAIDDGTDDEDGSPTVPLTPVQLGDGGPLGVVTDPALAAHLTSGDGMVAAHRFLAELAITWLEAPSIPRAAVVHLPPDADIDPDVVATALGALANGPAVQAVPVEQVFQDVPPLEDGPGTVPLAPHEIADDLGPIAPALRSARDRVAGVGALLGDPGVTTSLEQSLLLSTGTDTPDDQRAAYVDRADAALSAVDGAVTLPDEFRITLTSRSSTIPITITNQSDQELEVRVELDSDQLEFPDGDVLTPVLAADTTTRLEVPVRTRTSGAFTLDVTVTSPDGTIVLDTSTFDVRSTAISGVGLALSIGAGLFLAIWWAKHWRGARRSRRLDPPGSTPGHGGGGESPGHTGPPGPGAEPSGAQPRTDTPVPEAPYRPAHMARHRTRSG